MDPKGYPFEPGGPVRLRIDPTGTSVANTKIFSVLVDDKPVGEAAKLPRVPSTIALSDGSQLVIEYREGFGGVGEGWRILRDGAPLPGSTGAPDRLVTEAAAAMYLIAVVTAIAGVLSLAGWEWIRRIGVSPWSLADAGVFGLLAWLTGRRVLIALLIGAVLFAGESVYVFSFVTPTAPAIIVRLLVLLTMLRALPPLWRQRARSA